MAIPTRGLSDNNIHEYDENGNLIFEWLAENHLNITDGHIDLTENRLDYIHMNSLAIDYDGHIIASCRTQSAVIKINRVTGDIIWYLGGDNNSFEFVNDEHGISFQHDARPVHGQPNHYTIFDNGNEHTPQFSRGIEYHLDMDSMQATMIWDYRHTPDRFADWMGSVQRLPNGNSLINYADLPLPVATEVTPDGEIVYEGNFVEPSHCYRTFRFDWNGVANRPYFAVGNGPRPDFADL